MLKENYIKVIIPQYFNFKLLGINNEEDKQKFLQRICEESVNSPIIQNEKVIGVISESKINGTEDGIVSGGSIWCDIVQELIKDKTEYKFACTVLKNKNENQDLKKIEVHTPWGAMLRF
jgi:predicted methyltransferase MtxX (methanogen marker protein 4)